MAYLSRRRFRRGYRRVFGHKSPYRRVFGSRNAGQAIGVSYRTALGPARDIAKLAAEIRGIKQRQNVEKKHYEAVLTGTGDEAYEVGQVDADAEGTQNIDITPSISQGIAHNQRVGNSLKLTGIALKYQIHGMDNLHAPLKVKFTLVKVSSPDIAAVSTNEVRSMIWDTNPLTGVRDTNAPLNYATLKQNGIKIIRTHTCRLPAAPIDTSAISNDNQYKAHKTGLFSIAMQDIVRFASASATVPEGHKYYLFVQCDTGNKNPSTSSTKTDIPVVNHSTGASLRLHAKYWWVDN